MMGVHTWHLHLHLTAKIKEKHFTFFRPLKFDPLSKTDLVSIQTWNVLETSFQSWNHLRRYQYTLVVTKLTGPQGPRGWMPSFYWKVSYCDNDIINSVLRFLLFSFLLTEWLSTYRQSRVGSTQNCGIVQKCIYIYSCGFIFLVS